MAVSANTLFHFTKKKEGLEGILLKQFHPKYSLEDLSNAIPESQVFAARIPMVCFCDIPFSQIKEHINFYGDYGIGLRKKGWGIRKGVSPIIYIPANSISAGLIQKMTSEVRNLLKDKIEKDSIHHHLPDFYKYIKAYDGLALNRKDKKMESRIFYNEREWRYVPKDFPVLPEKLTQGTDIEEENKKMIEKHSLRFTARDIKYIIVRRESEIPYFVKFIETKLKKQFNLSDRKLLVSKLISAEQIREDM